MNNIYRLFRCGGFLFVISCLFSSTNPLHAQWTQTSLTTGGSAKSFAVLGTNLFAGLFGGGLFLSTNNGTSWTAVGPGYAYVWGLAVSGTNLFVGTHGAGVFLSTNNGTSWTAVNSGLTRPDIWSLAVAPNGAGTNLFAGTDSSVFLSTNNGTSWTSVNSGLTRLYVWALAVSPNGTGGSNLFAGNDSGVFLSTNNGTSWTTVNSGLPNNRYVTAFAVSGTNIFAGTSPGGVFLSTNNGTSWSGVNNGLTNTYVTALAVSPASGGSGTNLFVGTDGSGVFLSTNNGTSWTAANSGITNTYIDAFAVSGTNLFAGISGAGVWRRPLSEMLTSVPAGGGATGLPAHFGLEQNYPNPFNPATTISFSLPAKSFVTLKVFDALGREVSVLLADELAAGTYAQKWDAAALPSGVYYYRLLARPISGGQAGSFKETKKLLLLR